MEVIWYGTIRYDMVRYDTRLLKDGRHLLVGGGLPVATAIGRSSRCHIVVALALRRIGYRRLMDDVGVSHNLGVSEGEVGGNLLLQAADQVRGSRRHTRLDWGSGNRGDRNRRTCRHQRRHHGRRSWSTRRRLQMSEANIGGRGRERQPRRRANGCGQETRR